jgi:hypothetical protein
MSGDIDKPEPLEARRNVVYVVSRSPEWIDVARAMRKRLGWEPRYWVTLPANHDAVAEAFPDIVAHPFLDLNRGLPAAQFRSLATRGLSLRELEASSPYEPIAMDLLDRIDLGRSFSHQERQRLIHGLLGYWLAVIDKAGLDLAVFNVPPHSIGEYLLYAAFRILGRPVRIFRPTPLNHLHIVCDQIERLPDRLRSHYEAIRAKGLAHLSTRLEASIRTLETADEDYRPWYLEDVSARDERSSHVRRKLEAALDRGFSRGAFVPGEPLKERTGALGLFRRGTGILSRRRKAGDIEPVRQAFKVPGRPLSAPVLTKWEHLTYKDWAMIDKIELEREYAKLCRAPNLDSPFVYFAMHYQPERTTCPDGGRFSDQFLAARLIAGSLPEGWRLLVKEHPSQFTYHGSGELSRWRGCYEELAALPATALVPLDVSSQTLIGRSAAVATITGAAGWEALVRQKPVLCFGAAWYGLCRGAYLVENAEDVGAAFRAITAGSCPSREDVTAYAAAMQEIGKPAFTNPSLKKAVTLDAGLVETLTSLLCEFESAVDGSQAAGSQV